ncbi:MAG: PHP domain-containing protein, partial [Candidatus Dormibacteraeota bacterium]|nr:PHP domain-containing protein [Candidatus Dormibacteraeota bacterium]
AAAGLLGARPELAERREANRLQSIPGVGAGIARTLAEVMESGTGRHLQHLREETGAGPDADSDLDMSSYRGDLHCHTLWSDGGASVRDMAIAAKARGQQYVAITDHSPRISVVHGLGPERLAAQRREIEAANAELEGITVLQGCEVDILEDGTLDLPDAALEALDLVIASPHVKLRMERAAMTERMLRAVGHPLVDMVGHPTGRRPGSRPGADYDLEAVFESAARNRVVLEIDCDPARMDLSPENARVAAGLGCRLSLDSDAHAPDQFAYTDLGLWSARLAGIPAEILVNWLPLERLRVEVLD